MKASIAEVRRKQIRDILQRDGNIQTDDIAKIFDVTTETIRKDIKILQERGLAKKCHGGAMAVGECVVNKVASRFDINKGVKELIAVRALDYIQDRAVIYLGPGTTTHLIAQHLVNYSNLTIFTSSILVAQTLAESSNRVYMLGGLVNGMNLSVHGMWSNEAIGEISPNIAFMGCSGLNGYNGPTCGNFEEAETLKKIIQSSAKAVVVCDSSKFNWTALTMYAKWESIDVFITDSNLSQENQRMLRQRTELVMVDAKEESNETLQG